MQRRILRVAVPAAGAVVSWLGAALYVVWQGGFGAGDLPAFGLWCAVFGVCLSLAWWAFGPLASAAKPWRRHVKAGLVGCCVGVILTIAFAIGFGPSVGAFSFPVGLFWIVGPLTSFPAAASVVGAANPSSRLRMLLIGLALPAAMVSLPTILLMGDYLLWGRAQHEVYELPAGFTGPVIVVYDVGRAPAIPIESESLRIRVPASGVVVTSSPPNLGWKRPDVAYVDGTTAVPVPADWPYDNDSLEGVRTFWLGSRGRVTVNGVPEPYLEYQAFAVASPAQDRAVRRRSDQLLDSLTLLFGR